jgi:hypothetical protein
VRLELTYLVRAADGSVLIPLRTGPASWPTGSQAPVPLELAAVRASVIPLEALARDKSRPREDAADAAKDDADSAVLSALKLS